MDHALVRILTEMERFCRINVQGKGDGFQFLGGVRQAG